MSGLRAGSDARATIERQRWIDALCERLADWPEGKPIVVLTQDDLDAMERELFALFDRPRWRTPSAIRAHRRLQAARFLTAEVRSAGCLLRPAGPKRAGACQASVEAAFSRQ